MLRKKNIWFLLIFSQSLIFAQTIKIRAVVHVLYKDAKYDLSNQQVLQYIDYVNKAYSKQLTPTFTRQNGIFDASRGNPQIEIVLANTDPDGNTTNGITHNSGKMAMYTAPTDPVWEPTKYLNIYLSESMPEPGYPNFVMAGYASSPDSPVLDANNSTFNFAVAATNGTPLFTAQSLTHEVGHVFGLRHISEDNFADTPMGMESIYPSTGYSSLCNSTLQESNTTTLSQDGNFWGGIDPPDMVENFMGLSFCCSYMFTNDQASEMRAYIKNNYQGWIITDVNTGIEEKTKEEIFSLHPNPSSNDIFIECKTNNNEMQYYVFDLCGRILKSGYTKHLQAVNIYDLEAGIYYISINDQSTQIKFIKQ